jgi:hypothetical protein
MVKKILQLSESRFVTSSNTRCVRAIVNDKSAKLSEPSLCRVVSRWRFSQCSDIRDKVYAVLGLAPSGRWFPVDYSMTKEGLFCSVILASYSNTPADTSSSTDSRAIVPHPRGYRNASAFALTEAYWVARALEISFNVLESYLATRTDLRDSTLITFEPSGHTAIDSTNDVVEHCYILDDFTAVVLSLSKEVPDVEGDGQQKIRCKAIFGARLYFDEQICGQVTCTDNSPPLMASLILKEDSLSLPFKIFIFLVGIVNKIRHLTDEHLRIIKANNDCRESAPDKEGQKYTTLRLNSVSFD